MPADKEASSKERFASKKSLGSAFGALSKYARPELIPEEEGAFARAMIEKHAGKDISC